MRSWSLSAIALICAGGAVLCARELHANLPGDDSGYSPQQPIEFSHRLHCGELELNCQYCHTGVDKSRHAGIPPAETCMNCHRYVSAAHRPNATEVPPVHVISSEIAKLYDAVGFDASTRSYDASRAGPPIEWIKVHDLPDFVSFDHSRHVLAGVDCRQCHGDVSSMDRVVQVRALNMGWCVNCHRDVQKETPAAGSRRRDPSTDCGVCHY